MAKAAADIEREKPRSEAGPDRYAPPSPRPGWVTDLVIRVLAGADRALSPHDVHRRSELVHGQRIARSSIRNALRIASSETDAAIERVGYGSYRLRAQPAS